ncbi:MAG TPA: 3-keto-5-aminohexanoate cleavage protein [Gemmatimonadales bacterium]|nr:3-keto-5-aminohexanoate cleavage protein [Gemmatimonadales bacterium]
MILHAALNGARHRADHAPLPVTPTELAAAAAERLVDSGLGAQCLRVLLEPSEPDAAAALETVVQLEAVLDRAGVRSPRLLHGTDETTWRLIAEAATRGYDTRVGLEDTLTLPDGRPTPGNAALVAEARRCVSEAAGRR